MEIQPTLHSEPNGVSFMTRDNFRYFVAFVAGIWAYLGRTGLGPRNLGHIQRNNAVKS